MRKQTTKSAFPTALLAGVVLAIAVGLSVDRAAAQETTTPPASAAARLQLFAEKPQPQVQVITEQPPPSAPSPRPPSAVPPNDPTMPNGALRDLLGEDKPKSAGPTPAMPDIRLRARVIVHGKTPTALVEIGGAEIRMRSQAAGAAPQGPNALGFGGQYRTIREGEEFVVPQGDSVSPVRVVKLSATEVLLEIVNRRTLIRLD